jgi:hypothetical protein
MDDGEKWAEAKPDASADLGMSRGNPFSLVAINHLSLNDFLPDSPLAAPGLRD